MGIYSHVYKHMSLVHVNTHNNIRDVTLRLPSCLSSLFDRILFRPNIFQSRPLTTSCYYWKIYLVWNLVISGLLTSSVSISVWTITLSPGMIYHISRVWLHHSLFNISQEISDPFLLAASNWNNCPVWNPVISELLKSSVSISVWTIKLSPDICVDYKIVSWYDFPYSKSLKASQFIY